MTTDKSLAIREVELRPQDVVTGATIQAKLLMDIVEKTHCFQEISGKKYLQVEAWETIGAFNRTHSETESIIPILRENDIIGYQARVQLWKDGVIIGGAIMPCFFTENCCKGKDGDAKHKASMSAAQTFATSKAYRMNFSYVAILAGYQPLPAEEVTEDMVDKTQHWCSEHNTAFFKKGKMKWWAHKIEGSDKWCSEEAAKKIKEEPEVSPDVETTPKDEMPESEGDFTPQDLYDWVAQKKNWKNSAPVRSYLINSLKISGEKIDNDPMGCKEEIRVISGWED